MSLSIGDNFNYQGKKPNFARDSYDTKQALKAVKPEVIDDGHLAFCVEDKLTYKFDSTNEAHPQTGYWRPFGGIASIQVPELATDYTVEGNPSLNYEIVYYIQIGEIVHNITGDSSIKWQNGQPPVVEENSVIVVSVLNNLAVWGIFR